MKRELAFIFAGLALLLGLSACESVSNVRERVQDTGKEVTKRLVDRYCEAADPSIQAEIRSRLHLYLDNRIITEIDCGEPT